MSVLLICQLRWCTREVLLSLSVYLLKIASFSLWDLLLSYTQHVVLMGDDKEHPRALAVVIDSGMNR